MKPCSKCKLTKDFSRFTRDKSISDGYARYCKECTKAYRSDPKNKKAIQKASRVHYMNHKELHKRLSREGFRRRYKKDVQFRLKINLRNRLNMAIKNKQKVGSAIDELGCSVEELRVYLEKLFYPHPVTGESMSWNNWGRGRGKWSIDHILELHQVNIENKNDFKKVSHFTNLRPLWYEDHLKKA